MLGKSFTIGDLGVSGAYGECPTKCTTSTNAGEYGGDGSRALLNKPYGKSKSYSVGDLGVRGTFGENMNGLAVSSNDSGVCAPLGEPNRKSYSVAETFVVHDL